MLHVCVLHVYLCVCVACMRVCMHVYMCVRVYMHVHVHAHARIKYISFLRLVKVTVLALFMFALEKRFDLKDVL